MNRKGEFGGVGTLIIIAVAVIVAVTLLTGGITGGVGTLTSMSAVTNGSYTFPANNSYLTLSGQSVSNVVVINATSGAIVPATNYTIINDVVSNGQLVSQLYNGRASLYSSKSVNISYDYEPFGYESNGGGRAIAGLIIIFSALAIAIVVLAPVIKEIADLS